MTGRRLIAAAYTDGYTQARGGTAARFPRALTDVELAAWMEGWNDGHDEPPPQRTLPTPRAAADDHGPELLRVATMAAGAFVKAHPSASSAFEDLLGDAAVGAAAAASRYDPEGGATLTTYAYKRAAGAIVDGIRERSLVSRTEMARGVRLADLPAHRQQPGSWDELAEVSLHPVDPAPGPETLAERAEELRQLRAAIGALPRRCGDVLVRSFLGGETLQAIADDLGVTIAQVSQDRKRALALLRSGLGGAWHGRPVVLHGGCRARSEQLAYLERLASAGVVA